MVSDAWIYWKEEESARKWKPIPDTAAARKIAIKQGAMFFTWMSFSEQVGGDGRPEPNRKGFFPFDSDCKENPQKALDDIRTLCLVHLPELYEVDPYAIRFYATGSKGFHAEIPAELFGAEAGDPYLPHIYKRIACQWAAQFDLSTSDLSLFCMGHGKQWRIPNVQRSNGRHKALLTLEELRDLTIDELMDLTREPRQIELVDVDLEPVPDLVALYRDAKAAVYHERAEQTEAQPLTDAQIELLSAQIPPCIDYILREMPPKSDTVNFNRLLMILVNYFRMAGADERAAWTKVEGFVRGYPHSDTYDTADKRVRAWRSMWKYLDGNKDYSFACSYVRGLKLQGETFDCGKCLQKEERQSRSFNLTDLGNAERLVAAHGQDIRFCYAWGKWFIWDNMRWAIDDTGEILRLAKGTVRGIYEEASKIDDDDRRKALVKHARSSEAVGKLSAMATLAQSETGIPIRPDDLDLDPWAFNCLNGTVDLCTGELRPHRREDMISKVAPVRFDAAAKCREWLAFLDKITAGRKSLIEYLQKAIGWALTGIDPDRTMWILYGSGANGKTILTATMGGMLGDYAMETPVETLMIRKGEGIPNDVARLKGARLVTAAEGERGQRLAESLIKRLTGGDKVCARFLHGEFFEFVPTFKLFLSTNHKPIIRGTDTGIWDRLHLVPFDLTIPPAERIPRTVLMERLRREWPGILAWAVEGCLKWQREGLQKPEEVETATEGYREEMDILGGFLADCCVLNPLARVTVADLWTEYERWCEANNEGPLKKNTFTSMLKERGIKPGNVGRASIRGWHGIGLREKCGHADICGHGFQGFSYREKTQEKKGVNSRPRMSACPQNITCAECADFQPNQKNPSLIGTCAGTPHDGDLEQWPKLVHECGHFRSGREEAF